MPVIKCKACGGDLQIVDSTNRLGRCQYCGREQTLPSEENEKKVNLFNRANHYRQGNDFDRAKEVYEKVLEIDPGEPEAFWGMTLCRYGIEYVEDPKTRRRIPTCHRTSIRSILDDTDYLAALSKAKPLMKLQYQKEAQEIDRLQKEILSLASHEEPFDVFISYKEKDDRNGKRTVDSVLAQDIYEALVKEGYKVFFSRITLETRAGQQYEPIIYSALRTSKVLIAVGTRTEYFQAPWVKNEWGRFLSLMEEVPGTKSIIPVYKTMDPYDMPEEFQHFQAINADNVGYLQDLLHGIKKLKEYETDSGTRKTDNALLVRAELFLQESDFSSAKTYAERYLDQFPQDWKGYLVAFLAEKRCTSEKQLATLCEIFKSDKTYLFALKFAPPNKQQELAYYAECAIDNLRKKQEEEARRALDMKRREAQNLRNEALREETTSKWEEAAELYRAIGDNIQEKDCLKQAFSIYFENAKRSNLISDLKRVELKCKNARLTYEQELVKQYRLQLENRVTDLDSERKNLMIAIDAGKKNLLKNFFIGLLFIILMAYPLGKMSANTPDSISGEMIALFVIFSFVLYIYVAVYEAYFWRKGSTELREVSVGSMYLGSVIYSILLSLGAGESKISWYIVAILSFGFLGIVIEKVLSWLFRIVFVVFPIMCYTTEIKAIEKKKQPIMFDENAKEMGLSPISFPKQI